MVLLLGLYNFLFLIIPILLVLFPVFLFVCFLYLQNNLHIIVKSKDFAVITLHVYFLVSHLRLGGTCKHKRLYFCSPSPFLSNEVFK